MLPIRSLGGGEAWFFLVRFVRVRCVGWSERVCVREKEGGRDGEEEADRREGLEDLEGRE